MDRPSLATRDILRAAAFNGAIVLPDDITVMTTRNGTQYRYDPSTMLIPGCLGGEFLSKFTVAFNKGVSSQQARALQSFLKQRVREGGKHSALEGPVCRFDPNFFDDHTMSAILNMDFRSGDHIDSEKDLKEAFLSPYHFIRTLEKHSENSTPRIPSNGLFANAIADLTFNIFYCFHMFYHDYTMSAILGQGHSPFSRFSPLGGQLLF